MKAIRYHSTGGPEVLQLDEVPKPEPGPDQVLVKVEAIGVNYSEIGRRSGVFPLMPGHALPQIPGNECAGTVEHTGANVTGFNPGDRVLVRGYANTYAEYAAVPASAVYGIPPHMSITDAAITSAPFSTAWVALVMRGKLLHGETVLVQACASGVGIAVVQLAKHMGATVIGTASTDDKLTWAKRYGLDHGINYVTHDFVAEVKRLTEGKGVPIAVDGVGGEVLLKSLQCLAPEGRLVVYGVASGQRQVTVTVPELWFRNLSITGAGSGSCTREAMQQLIALVADGRLKATLDRTWPLAQAAEAHRHIEARRVRGKVALLV